MKKIIFALMMGLIALGVLGCDTMTTTQPTTQPITEPSEWISITTIEELQSMDMTKAYRLAQDLDLSGIEWEPIGSLSEPFSGWFDGDNHTLSNLTITQPNHHYNGLFGIVTGSIKNLSVTDYDINYTDDFISYAGGLAAHMTGNITNVTVSGSITINNLTSNTYAGGLVGFHSAYLSDTTTVAEFTTSNIVNAHATVTLDIKTENFAFVGGLVGKTYNSHLDHTSAIGTLQALSRNYRVYLGGLIGHNFGGILVSHESLVDTTDITIEHSYASTSLTVIDGGTWGSVGGLIGYNQYGQIIQSYAFADVTLESDDHGYVGGLIGEDWNSTIDQSVAALNLAVLPDENDTNQLRVSGLIGSINDVTSVTTSFYRSVAYDGVSETAPGSLVPAINLVDASWYTTILSWDDTLMDVTNAIAVLSQD